MEKQSSGRQDLATRPGVTRQRISPLWLAAGGVLALAAIVMVWLIWGRATPVASLPAAIPTPLVVQGTPLPAPLEAIGAANVKDLAQLARLGYGRVRSLAYSPDNNWLAAGTTAGIIVYDLSATASPDTLRQANFIATAEETTGVAIAPGGKVLAAAWRGANQLWLWPASGAAMLLADGKAFERLAFSPDGSLLAASAGNEVGLWRAADGKQLHATLDWAGTNVDEVQQLAFSPDGALLAARVNPDTLLLWHMPDGKLATRHDAAAYAFSADGKLLAAIDDRAISIWDPTSEERAEPLQRFDAGDGISPLTALAMSRDGKMLAVAATMYADGNPAAVTVELWSLDDNRRVQVLEAGTVTGKSSIVGLAFSSDGSRLTAVDFDGAVSGWTLPDGAPVTMAGISDPGYGRAPIVLDEVTFAPDGSTLTGLDHTTGTSLGVWNLNDARLRGSADLASGQVVGTSFTANGSVLEVYQGNGATVEWDVAGLTQRRVLQPAAGGQGRESFGANTAFLGVDIDSGATYLWRLTDANPPALPAGRMRWTLGTLAPDGASIAAKMSSGRSVGIWRVADGALRQVFYVSPLSSGYATDVEFSPDGQVLATSSVGGTVRLWRVADGALLREWQGSSSPTQLAYSPDGATLAVGMAPARLELRSTVDGSVLASASAHERDLSDLIFSPDGSTLATAASDEKAVKLWRAADLAMQHALEAQEQVPLAVGFSPDGARLAIGSNDGIVRLWDPATGNPQGALEPHTAPVWYLAFASDGGTVVGLASDGAARYWRAAEGTMLRTAAGPWAWAGGYPSPDGAVRVSALGGDHLLVWNAGDGSLIRVMRESTSPLLGLDFSPEGDLAIGSHDGKIRIWSMSDGALLTTLQQGDGSDPAEFVKFAAGGTLATGPVDGGIQLWRVTDGTPLRQLKRAESDDTPGGGQLTKIACSPDGRLLAGTLSNGSVVLWDVANGNLLKTWQAHAGYATAPSFSPDGRLLATGGYADATARLWGILPR